MIISRRSLSFTIYLPPYWHGQTCLESHFLTIFHGKSMSLQLQPSEIHFFSSFFLVKSNSASNFPLDFHLFRPLAPGASVGRGGPGAQRLGVSGGHRLRDGHGAVARDFFHQKIMAEVSINGTPVITVIHGIFPSPSINWGMETPYTWDFPP